MNPLTNLCSDAIAAMREVGIDISSQQPKHTEEFIGQRFAVVITLCDREKERFCPIFPGTLWHPFGRWMTRQAAESEASAWRRYVGRETPYTSALSNSSVNTL